MTIKSAFNRITLIELSIVVGGVDRFNHLIHKNVWHALDFVRFEISAVWVVVSYCNTRVLPPPQVFQHN